MKIKKLTLSDSARRKLLTGFRPCGNHCFRMRCRAILLNADGLGATQVGKQTEMTAPAVGSWANVSANASHMGKTRSLSVLHSPVFSSSEHYGESLAAIGTQLNINFSQYAA